MNICHRLVLYYYVAGRRSLLSYDPVLLWEVEAGVYDIDILPGEDICHILYKADLILFYYVSNIIL